MKGIKTVFLSVFLFGSIMLIGSTAQAKTYTVTPKTKPCNNSAKGSNYNKNTKQYYMLRSYLNKIESEGGGKLIIKKGTYKIPNTLFVASHTQIELQEGAVLKKTTAGGPTLKPSNTIFIFIRSTNAKKTGIYGGHEGEEDISITGKGIIDLNYYKSTTPVIAIIMGHNKNVTLDGITIKNMAYGHMIEMDACQDVTIKNCTFTGFTESGKWNKEAINLDVPDPDRQGFNAAWSKKDKTPNENILIENNVFETLEAGIGSHRYTGDVLQTDVQILNNTFTNCQTAVRVLNYKNAVIKNNTFTNCIPNERYPYSFFIAGVHGIDFSSNSFTNCGGTGKLLEFWCDKGYNAGQTVYPPVTSELTEAEAAGFMTNTAVGCGPCKIYNCPWNVDFTQ